MQSNLNARDAKRIIHAQHHVLPHIGADALPMIARAWAAQYNIPKPVMLRAMSRYVRLHYRKG